MNNLTVAPNIVETLTNDYRRLRLGNGDSDITFDYRYTDTGFASYEECFFEPDFEQPAASVIVLAEINKEPYENIFRTLGALATACQEVGPTEVILWSNTRLNNLETDADRARYCLAKTRWEILCKRLAPIYRDHEIVRLRVPHRFIDENQNANDLRTHSMDDVCMDAGMRDFPMTHPVIWLDADTTYIGKQSIRRLIAPLRNEQAHFTRANLLLTGEADGCAPFINRTEAEKTAAIYSMARRMIERNLQPHNNRGYVDECGLAFTIGTFLKAGGVSTLDPNVGESRSLLERGRTLLDSDIPLIRYVNDAPVGNSYRRFVKIAGTRPPIDLPRSEDGDDYVDYTSMEQSNDEAPSILVTRAALEDMIDYMNDRQVARTGHQLNTGQRRQLSNALTRFGF